MLRRGLIIFFLLWVALWSPAFAAQAPGPKSLGNFGEWRTFITSDKGQNVCYMALKTHGAPLRLKKSSRGPIVLMITQRPGENIRDVVSYNAGYNFKPSSDMRISFGKASFDLFTDKDTAWSRDAMTDHALAMAITRNSSFTARGIPAATGAGAMADTLNLKGSMEAYQAIGKACGIEVEAPSVAPKPHKKTPK